MNWNTVLTILAATMLWGGFVAHRMRAHSLISMYGAALLGSIVISSLLGKILS